MEFKKINIYACIVLALSFVVTTPGKAQHDKFYTLSSSSYNHITSLKTDFSHYMRPGNQGHYGLGQQDNRGSYTLQTAQNSGRNDRKTTSLTAGYIADEFNLQSDNGSYRFRFDGESSGIMLSSKSASLMLTYGVADAEETEGDIRSITGDLNFGGNITLFRNFIGLPIGGFIPIRVNMGYRNLELLDAPESSSNNTANIAAGSLGGGLGAEIRLPTGLPILEDNITGFATIVSSVGGLGDLTGSDTDGIQAGGNTIDGLRLTKSTDFNIEAKFERLLGGNLGVTAGLTLRWLHWTDEEAENFRQIFDVVSGEQEGLELRGTQSFFRVGINW